MLDADEMPEGIVEGRANLLLPREKRCQSCGCRMWVGKLRCPLCDAPMHFAGRSVSTDARRDEILKVVVFRLARFDPPPERRQRIISSWLRRHVGWSQSNVPGFLIRVTLATAVVAALFVAGLNLL